KQIAEILRLIGGVERLFADGFEMETEFCQIEIRERLSIKGIAKFLRVFAGWNWKSNRRQISESVGPHFLSSGESDEGFGCAAILLPIVFILGTKLVDKWKASVPFGGAFCIFDSGEIRHERAIRPGLFHWDDGVDTKAVCCFEQFGAGFWEEI